MQRSLNEIEMTLLKAARGAGRPMGVAEDLARAGVWLCRLGCNGVSIAIDTLEASERQELAIEYAGRESRLREGEAMQVVLALIDFALSEQEQVVRLPTGLPVPQILIGAAGQFSSQYGLSFSVVFGKATEVLISPDGVSVIPLDLPMETVVSIRTLSTVGDSAIHQFINHRPIVDAVTWSRAEALAALTYVPASEQSRVGGAGAGLTDND